MTRRTLAAVLSVNVDGDVALVLTVRNVSPAPQTIEFPSAQRCDFVIRARGAHDELWRWSGDRMFAAMTSSRTLAPGEAMECTGRWAPGASGTYSATAILASSTHAAEASVDFTVS